MKILNPNAANTAIRYDKQKQRVLGTLLAESEAGYIKVPCSYDGQNGTFFIRVKLPQLYRSLDMKTFRLEQN